MKLWGTSPKGKWEMKHKMKMGAALIAVSALLLTGCGGGDSGNGPEGLSQATSDTDIKSLIADNAQPRENLKDGGTLTLPVGQLGPNFNYFADAGFASDNGLLNAPMNNAGCWKYDYDGTASVDENYCTAFDMKKEDDGTQTFTIKINENAKWNDGTPIDYNDFVQTWKIMNGSDEAYVIRDPNPYNKIASVERGSNDKEVIVKTSTAVYPISDIFDGFFNRNINTPEIFNNGMVNKMIPEWMSGPFKLQNYDSAALTATLVPNENWWGDKPVLDKITFRQMESQATYAAFKNGEIDTASGRTASAYSTLDGTPGSEVRKGQRLFTGGMKINAKSPNMQDVAVRKAAFAAVDRPAIRDVRFQGLNWTEGNPGSMLVMPFSKYYQDNWPIPEDQQGTEGAKKVLEDAGYTLNSDGIYEKDGKTVSFKIVNFGNDPIGQATIQTMIAQFKAAGMDVSIDQKADADFADVIGNQKYDMTTSGNGVGADASSAVSFYYSSSASEGPEGADDFDQRIKDLAGIEDNAERNKAAMDVEKDYQAKYFVYGTINNGPDILFVKQGLANYGPSLFKSRDWTLVGWQK